MTEQDRLDEELEALGRELRRIPTPLPPGGLVSRVSRLAHLELAARADERFSRQVLVFLLFFSWMASAFSLLVVRLLSGEGFELAYFISAWVSGAAMLVLLALHVRKERKLA